MVGRPCEGPAFPEGWPEDVEPRTVLHLDVRCRRVCTPDVEYHVTDEKDRVISVHGRSSYRRSGEFSALALEPHKDRIAFTDVAHPERYRAIRKRRYASLFEDAVRGVRMGGLLGLGTPEFQRDDLDPVAIDTSGRRFL